MRVGQYNKVVLVAPHRRSMPQPTHAPPFHGNVVPPPAPAPRSPASSSSSYGPYAYASPRSDGTKEHPYR
eukprot:1023644-Prymnesium_polylepis.1